VSAREAMTGVFSESPPSFNFLLRNKINLMTSFHWQLQLPMNTIVFDCDGTLSTLEGIDELAKKNGVGDIVCAMTANAMGQTGLNSDLYTKRLDLVKPTAVQVLAQGKEYFAHVVPDVDQVIRIFQRLQKQIYIVSAGLYPAVSGFGELLGVPRENIFAVGIEFDESGEFKKYDTTSPLVYQDGKRIVLESIKKSHADTVYIGDGLNDYAVYHMVNRFVGYGGIFYHEKLAEKCQYYIKTPSMAALLPLSLTASEACLLHPVERELYDKGMEAITGGTVVIR
jgi:phosphoserine phosphatase